MADVMDVANALCAIAVATVYPNGTGQASVAGCTIKVFPGWPTSQQLAVDMAAGVVDVSVYPRPEEHDRTRYPLRWQGQAPAVTTLTLTVAAQTITVGGTAPAAGTTQNCIAFVNGLPHLYAAASTDTLNSIAAGIATSIGGGASAAGAVVTLPSSARIGAVRVGAAATAMREIARQERLFQLVIWAPSPTLRDAVAGPIDVALKSPSSWRITLPDQSVAFLKYRGSPFTDGLQKQGIFRRDLLYTAEYGTFETETETEITAVSVVVTAEIAGQPPAQPVVTVNA